MPAGELERQQDRLLPKVDLSAYAGQWVALRDGRVVASDLDPAMLRDNPDVRNDDVLAPVPSGDDSIFIL